MPNVRGGPFRTFNELRQRITPTLGNLPERVPWQWYDTQSYVSGTTTQLDFFQTVQADKTRSNVKVSGSIPSPMFFEVHHVMVHVEIPPSFVITATNDGAIEDVWNLLRGVLTLTVADKVQYESRIKDCPSGGGVWGGVSNAATLTAPAQQSLQHANNGIPDIRNRVMLWGDLILPHNQQFLVRCNWAGPITLQAGNLDILVGLDGFLYRRVL